MKLQSKAFVFKTSGDSEFVDYSLVRWWLDADEADVRLWL